MIEQLKRMAVLAVVVEQGSMKGAARVLGTTASAVSQQVRQLERDMGVTLLVRTTRKLRLTAAGQRFHEGCAAMLAAARYAGEQLAQLRDAPVGELRVSSPVGFARHLGPALAPLLAANPGLSLHLQVDDALIDLVEQRIDLAIRFGRLPDSTWVAHRLGEMRMMLCAAPAYLAARGVPVTPADLLSHDWLRTAGGSLGATLELHGPGGAVERLRVQARVTSNNQLSLQQMCEAGLGVAVMGDLDVEEALKAGRLVPLLPHWHPPPLGMYALTPRPDVQPAKVRFAIEALRRAMAPSGPKMLA
ncbi:MAG: transcriptional regulator [Caldimonas sp.]|uniref:LysR family transcriptional regulator n=1 Tax=Caldimonas taiwanensis TaxID=307483 RepID=UPI000AD92C95|nr:LysR family transcriptional regulator [Caldimonas taiwanensis]GIX24719.1 MAG: transcriptional regulator [Caldimonas sp.]